MLNQPTRPAEPTWLTIVRLLRWDKPAGRLILMLPALWAVFLASNGTPPLPLVGTIILGSLATSAAGCAINDLWDRDIDPQVERTRSRPLASRALSIKVAIVVAFIAFACAGILALYLNPLSFGLCFAAIPVIVFYPSAKRFFPIPQLVLSVAWGFAVLISWSAATGKLDTSAWILWGAVILWTLGFDTVYAMSDKEDDLLIGINSSAIFFGDKAADAVTVCFLATAGLLAWLGYGMSLNWEFWIASAIALVLWIRQSIRLHQTNLPRPAYGEIFQENVWIGFILLAGMIAGTLF